MRAATSLEVTTTQPSRLASGFAAAVAQKDVAPYMIFQVIGALLAGFVVKYLTPGMQITTRQLAAMPELVAEFLFTFALVFVVLNSATSKDNNGNSFYGLAIGFTVLAGGICGWRRCERRIQPRRRRGHFFHGAGLVESTMDISSGQFLWRSACCADFQASLSGGQVESPRNPAGRRAGL